MDFMPDKEFHRIFERASVEVEFRGAGTPAEINERLNQKIESYKSLARNKQMSPSTARRRISNLKKLIFSGFGRRTIDEVIADPQGRIALTLRHGREKARDVLLARARGRIGRLRRR